MDSDFIAALRDLAASNRELAAAMLDNAAATREATEAEHGDDTTGVPAVMDDE